MLEMLLATTESAALVLACNPLPSLHPTGLLQPELCSTRTLVEARTTLRCMCFYCQQPDGTVDEGQT